MKIVLLAAMSENRVIGRENRIPWHLPADLRRFKATTTGHHLIMGRRTFESIGKPLPGRTSIVLTRRPEYRPQGVLVAHTLDEALGLCAGDEEVFVIGGEAIYRLALPRADEIQLTVVHATIKGDARFPRFEGCEWDLVEDERFEADEHHEHGHSFRRYRRVVESSGA